MSKFLDFLLYFVIIIKILFIISILRYKILIKSGKITKDLEKKIKTRKEILHETFVFFMYIVIIILFNPLNKNIRIHEDPHSSFHLQIVLFALGVIELLNFDYDLILQAPRAFYNTITSNGQ